MKRHKEQGLCVLCNEKVVKGMTLCKFHLERNKLFQRHFQMKRKDYKYNPGKEPPWLKDKKKQKEQTPKFITHIR